MDASFESGGLLDPVRVWTTCLCVATLMELNEAYLVDEDFTLADSGSQWLEEQGLLFPAFGFVLGETLAKAKEQILAWERYQARYERCPHHSSLVDALCGTDVVSGLPHHCLIV